MRHGLLSLPIAPAYTTRSGAAYCGDSLKLLAALPDASINLVITSPPFDLQRQKAYASKDQADYVDWLVRFAEITARRRGGLVTHFGCGTPGAASKTSLPPERQNGCIGGGMSPPDWG